MHTVLIAGGAGGVGEGLVRAFLSEGWQVLVPGRSELKLERLKNYANDISTGKLVAFEFRDTDPQAMRQIVESHCKRLQAVVASLGGWTQGQKLVSVGQEVTARVLENNFLSHLRVIQAALPLLESGGSYFHINGFSAEEERGYPGAALVAAMAAAQKSMVLSLQGEQPDHRIFEIILGPMRTRDRIAHGHGDDSWYMPEEIGRELVRLHENKVARHDIIHRYLKR